MAAVDVASDVSGSSDLSGSAGVNFAVLSGLLAESDTSAAASAAWEISADLTGDSQVTADTDATVPVIAALAGSSDTVAALTRTFAVTSTLAAQSDITGTIEIDGDFMFHAQGNSSITAVALLRPPFVPPPAPGPNAPSQFAGLQVGRIPPIRRSTSTVNPNPPRRRREPR